jgi:hypothetical protein
MIWSASAVDAAKPIPAMAQTMSLAGFMKVFPAKACVIPMHDSIVRNSEFLRKGIPRDCRKSTAKIELAYMDRAGQL